MYSSLYTSFLFALLLVLPSTYATKNKNLPRRCDIGIVGAGPGGVYTAWRLFKSGNFEADAICIFERADTFGGRLRFANSSDVPELGPLVANLGGRNYRTQDVITKSLIEDVFELETECYNREPSCPGVNSVQTRFSELRGQLFTKEELEDPSVWPYQFRDTEIWPANVTRPTPFDSAQVAFPFLFSFFNSSGFFSPNETVRYQKAVEAVNILKQQTVNGIPINQLSIRSLSSSSFSTEFYAADRDAFGNVPIVDFIYSQNLYEAVRFEIYETVADPFGQSLNKHLKGNVPYARFVELMLQEFLAAGGSIYYNAELSTVLRVGRRGLLQLEFKNGDEVKVDKAFLNIQTKNLNDLDETSVIFREADPQLIQAIRSLQPVAISKVLLYYQDAWWRSNPILRTGKTTTTGLLGDIIYQAGSLNCTDELQTNCSGLLLAAYTTGESRRTYQSSYNLKKDPSDPLTVLRRTDPRTTIFLDELHQYLLELHDELINVTNIEPPTYGLLCDWPEGGSALRRPTDNILAPGNFTAQLIQPIGDLDLFLVNNEFGQIPGWAESSFVMAEKALLRVGLSKPDFVSDAWYFGNVLTDN